MHCYNTEFAGKRITGPGKQEIVPPWVDEGIAQWAGADIAGPGSTFDWGRARYLQHPEDALVLRSHDAIGFFSHIQDVRGDMWATIPAIVSANKPGESFHVSAFEAAVGKDRDAVLDSLPSSWLLQGLKGWGLATVVGDRG